MPKLISLGAIDTVENPRHRMILSAIRDTNMSLPQIAVKLNIPYTTVHGIANRYLSKTLLEKRRNGLTKIANIPASDKSEEAYALDDPVCILNEISDLTSSECTSTGDNAELDGIAALCHELADFDDDEGHPEKREKTSRVNKEVLSSGTTESNHLILEFQGIRLNYKSSLPFDIPALCQLIKTIRS